MVKTTRVRIVEDIIKPCCYPTEQQGFSFERGSNMARSRRRARGEGSVFQRKDGYWVAQLELGDGERKQYYLKTQKEAVEKLRKAQRELEQGTLVTGPQQTVAQYLEYWLEEVHKSNLKTSTYVKYQKVIRTYINPALGHLKLDKLTPQHVKSLYNKKLKDGLSPKSIHHIHGVLHKALDNAVKWNYVSRNVCEVVSPPRLVKPEMQALTMEQARKLLEHVRGHRLEVLLTLALTTGMRRGEILALRWVDIDFEHQTARIHRTVDYIHHGYVETEPKTMAGRRTIVLPSFVIESLKRHRINQLEARLQAGSAWEEKDLVFTTLTGGYFNPRYLHKTFSMLLQEAGLPHVPFHSLRHSAATLLRSMGVDLKVIQEILGHSNFTITANIYSHVFLEDQAEAMGRWDKALKPHTRTNEQGQ
jgi:integrase